MTTRHTISHADELYAGNAYLDGDSPDGRRGIPMTHLYLREYGAVLAQDDDGILCSYAPSAVIANAITLSSGVYLLGITTVGVTQLTLDVPRNLTVACTSAGGDKVNITGRDEYGQVMCESILSTANDGTYSSGFKAFSIIDKISTTVSVTSGLSVGVGNRLGLPYHLSNKQRFISLSIDGQLPTLPTSVLPVTGLDLSTISSTSEDSPDVRGTINLSGASAPDASKVFSALMMVDHTTRDKAYGLAQATAIT